MAASLSGSGNGLGFCNAAAIVAARLRPPAAPGRPAHHKTEREEEEEEEPIISGRPNPWLKDLVTPAAKQVKISCLKY